PKRMHWYFWALLVQGLATPVAYARWGNNATLYLWIYALTTAPILLAAFNLAWTSLDLHENRLRLMAIPAVLTVTIVRLAHVDLPKPLHAADWLVLAQAGILAFSGMIYGAKAPYLARQQASAFILGQLWVVRAVFDLGYELHLPYWEKFNSWVPAG